MDSEQYREQTAHPYGEKVNSVASAGNGGLATTEQGIAEEQNIDLISVLAERRAPPSSCVGYGGGEVRYHETPDLSKQGHWEVTNRGDSKEGSRYGKDISASDLSGTVVDQREWISRYGTVDPNARPSEAGFGSSGLGGYPDEGDYNMGSFGDASSGESGNYGRGGTTDESSVCGSEVRNGVRHGLTSDGVASGAGVTDGFGGRTPTSSDVEQHQYHGTEVAPSQQKDTPYSQMLTQLDGPSAGSRDRFQEGNAKVGTAADHQKEAREGAEQSESGGILKKFIHKLSGHGRKHEVTDGTSDVKEVRYDSFLELDEDETPGCITKLKDKLLPNHDKHYDEINPAIFE